MDAGHAQFTGSIPELYDRYLGPLFFEPYARDIAARVEKSLRGPMKAHVIVARSTN